MKYLLVLISVLFFMNISFCQEERDSNNFFFTTELDSLGACYGKCLLQAEWDTTGYEKTIVPSYFKSHPVSTPYLDTIFQGLFIYPEDTAKIKALLPYTDTLHKSIELSPRKIILSIDKKCNNNYEIVSESHLVRDSFSLWKCNGNYLNSYHWIKKAYNPVYEKRYSRVMKFPCRNVTDTIHAQHRSLIIIEPKENIEKWKTKNIYLLSNKNIVVTKFKRKEEMINTQYQTIKIITLNHSAIVMSKKIICTPTKSLITQLQKQLYTLGFYQGDFLGEFNDKTKEAIIKYQLKHKLPFGQLTEETVDHILSQETPFNK